MSYATDIRLRAATILARCSSQQRYEQRITNNCLQVVEEITFLRELLLLTEAVRRDNNKWASLNFTCDFVRTTNVFTVLHGTSRGKRFAAQFRRQILTGSSRSAPAEVAHCFGWWFFVGEEENFGTFASPSLKTASALARTPRLAEL